MSVNSNLVLTWEINANKPLLQFQNILGVTIYILNADIFGHVLHFQSYPQSAGKYAD